LYSGFARIEQALDYDALSSAHVPREKEKDSVVVEQISNSPTAGDAGAGRHQKMHPPYRGGGTPPPIPNTIHFSISLPAHLQTTTNINIYL